MSTRLFNSSFAGGEMSPEMFGRVEDTKYQSGAALVKNFLVTPRGPVENRPGFKYVSYTGNSGSSKSRLIPFTYSTDQTYILEFGENFIRFYTQGAIVLAEGGPTYNAGTAYEIGNIVDYSGANYYCIQAGTGNQPDVSPAYWYLMGGSTSSTILEIPTDYAEEDLFDIHYVQSADVLTLVHPNYPPRELRREGIYDWPFIDIDFVPDIQPPGVPITTTYGKGQAINITAITAANPGVFTTASSHFLVAGDIVYINFHTAYETNNDYYIVETAPSGTTFTVKNVNTGVLLDTTSMASYTSGGYISYSNTITNKDSVYKVTSIDSNGVESETSFNVTQSGNLYAQDSYNLIFWLAVTNAVSYNIYKKIGTTTDFGFIGNTEDTNFNDTNIAPDVTNRPSIYETPFTGTGNYPRAVTYYEQRRLFGGTDNNPQSIWGTRSGTETDLSYNIPLQDNDRLKISIASLQVSTIRHLVPLNQLLVLTNSTEYQIKSVDGGALTPTSLDVKPQSYEGASNVQPNVINNSIVFCSNRGGHLRELGYNWEVGGFLTGDLSVRAAHLFDGFDIVQTAYAKAPLPIVWCVSSSGKLLGLTYMPEQQVGAWHQHTTQGDFESCAVVPEGDEDVLYVVVKRTEINGTIRRFIERIETRQFTDVEDAFFVDCGLSYDGTNTDSTTMTVTGGTDWDSTEPLTLTASVATFNFPVGTDLNDEIWLYDGDDVYKLTIKGTSSTTVATVQTDKPLPASLRNTATTEWAFARDTFSFGHFKGYTVSILADGGVRPQQVVSNATGNITLDPPAVKVQVGLPYDSQLQTMPAAFGVEAFAQGRVKNVNNVRIKVYESRGFSAGPSEDKLTEQNPRTFEAYGEEPELVTDEFKIVIAGSWQPNGKVFIEQSYPLPLTVIGLTLETEIGG